MRDVLQRSLAKVGLGDDWWRIDVLLDEIGVEPETLDKPFGTLSGGWQRLLLIAAAARLEEPDILVLDEPTNHLDLANINTLERWLTVEFPVPMLIVSHDREFLDRVTERTLFLRSDGMHAFKTRFTQAREELLRRDAAAAAQARLEDKEIRRLEQAAARYKVWAVKNPDLNKRKNAVETRIARIEKERTQTYVARERRLELSDGDIDAKVALRIAGLGVTAPGSDRKLSAIDRLAIAAGDRIALLGATAPASRRCCRRWPMPSIRSWSTTTACRRCASIRPAGWSISTRPCATCRSTGRSSTTSLDVPGMTERDAIRHLARPGFPFAKIAEPIAVLSHGERARLVFLKMKLLRPNMYLLDEPTNHLDIEGQEDLEAQLEQSDVSCLFVSHDRYFTRTVANRFVEIRKGRLVEIDDAESFFEQSEVN